MYAPESVQRLLSEPMRAVGVGDTGDRVEEGLLNACLSLCSENQDKTACERYTVYEKSCIQCDHTPVLMRRCVFHLICCRCKRLKDGWTGERAQWLRGRCHTQTGKTPSNLMKWFSGISPMPDRPNATPTIVMGTACVRTGGDATERSQAVISTDSSFIEAVRGNSSTAIEPLDLSHTDVEKFMIPSIFDYRCEMELDVSTTGDDVVVTNDHSRDPFLTETLLHVDTIRDTNGLQFRIDGVSGSRCVIGTGYRHAIT